MKNKKARIDTYETVYYIDLVVANKYVTLKDLQKLYTYSDEVELDEDIIAGDCTTTKVLRKSDNKRCVLVKHNHLTTITSIPKDIDFINTIGHEAGHVVLDIYESIGQSVCSCSQEPFCYLLGWVTDRIYKTLKSK